MRSICFRLFGLGLLGAVTVAAPASAGSFEDGVDAYRAHDYLTASGHFYDAANRGHVEAQHRLGEMYERGRGVMRDPVMAHMWFTLAASNLTADPELRAAASNGRARVAQEMNRKQMAASFQLALRWKPQDE